MAKGSTDDISPRVLEDTLELLSWIPTFSRTTEEPRPEVAEGVDGRTDAANASVGSPWV